MAAIRGESKCLLVQCTAYLSKALPCYLPCNCRRNPAAVCSAHVCVHTGRILHTSAEAVPATFHSETGFQMFRCETLRSRKTCKAFWTCGLQQKCCGFNEERLHVNRAYKQDRKDRDELFYKLLNEKVVLFPPLPLL